ncbi:hypothetical protein [Pseudoxanthomonas mexicana]|uniref:hypothetical protein n=1 Tax=Pseudoxanthomonas mexicana TaxID=128785 RepID=UPI000783F7D4|nr:hypothetical protein [Pseudoxanthomonas mexicana]
MASMRWLRWVPLTILAAMPPATAGRTGEGDEALQRMHGEFVEAFVDSEGFGKRRVTPMMQRMRHYQFAGVGDDGRCVLDVELVGVARHDPAVVHVAHFMGFQHRDDDAAAFVPPTRTRGLQAWEREALSTLVAGSGMVVRETPTGTRAMGAIRARPACLACHDDRREGDVLGALSYGLGRLATPAQAEGAPYCRPERVTSS